MDLNLEENKVNEKIETASLGDSVKVHYIGTLESGEVFDASADEEFNSLPGRKPLEFRVGVGVIEGFTEGVIGLKVGEVRLVKIPPEKAYGKFDEKLVKEFPKKELEEAAKKGGLTLRTGMRVFANNQPAVISAIYDENVALNFNHELAGKTLNFKIKLLELKKTNEN